MFYEKKIVWIAIYPKSGNTWVRAFLSMAVYGRLNLNDLKIRSLASHMKDYVPKDITIEARGDIKFYLNNAQECLSNNVPEGTRLLMKTHNINGEIGGIDFPKIDNTFSAIYIIRDPRDVAISYSNYFDLKIEQVIKNMSNPSNLICGKNLSKYECISS